MPTGYTAAIKDGISFQKFATDCARAFGALVTMRDEPHDAEIPDEFKPSDYHTKKIAAAQKRLASMKSRKPAEWKKAHEVAVVKALKYDRDSILKNRDLKKKYEAMKEEASAWTPPSPDHENMKKFMIDQIEESIRFDCSDTYHEERIVATVVQSTDEWKAAQIASAVWDINYHTEKLEEEIKGCEKRTLWVKQLKESLK